MIVLLREAKQIRRLLILILIAFVFGAQSIQPTSVHFFRQKQNIEDFWKRYSSSIGDLYNLDKEALSADSRILLDDLLAILKSPEEESLRTKFIEDFPKTFSHFSHVFNPANFKELYDGHVFLGMFGDILKERPRETVGVLLGLSKDAKYDADAPSYLQYILADFICNYYDVFIDPFSKLTRASQQNIITFVCDVENFAAYNLFSCIVKALEMKGNAELLARFLAAKEARISQGPHGEKIRK